MMLAAGILIGVLLAAALGVVWLRRAVLAPLDALAVPGAAPAVGLDPGPRIAALSRRLALGREALQTDVGIRQMLESSLEQMEQGVLLVAPNGDEVLRNPVANAYLTDTHTGALLRPRVDDILAGVRSRGEVDEEISVFGPPARTFFVSARALFAPPANASGVPADATGLPADATGLMVVFEDVTDLQRLHEMRRDFVANLSHELKTPVGAISLLAETVVGETDPDTVGRLTGRLVDESSRLANVIDDLLALSHIEHDEQPPHMPVDLRDIMIDAASRVSVAADARGVQIDLVAEAESLLVRGDAQQLLSAVTNLFENAIKYSDEEDVVTAHAVVTDSQIELAVTDQGRGIPQQDLGRVFERFYRVDRSRKSATGGTGLGLAIVRHVAMNHGGSVDVVSAEGEGSTFTLRVPAMT